MTNRFRAILHDGSELQLPDVESVVAAIREKKIADSTMLYDERTAKWAVASEHDVVRATRSLDSLSKSTIPRSKAYLSSRGRSDVPEETQDQGPDATQSILLRLACYIGNNWDSHYRATFTDFLQASREGRSAWSSWNWPAALLPIWFLYRRLYVACFGFAVLFTVISALDNAASGSSEGGSAFALLFIGQIVLQGWVADRLLFRKAMQKVTTVHDERQLRRIGKPLHLVVWLLLGIIVVGILAAILIPLLSQ